MYYGGAAFYPDEGQGMHIVGTYDAFNSNPAIINFGYGNGRVILFGPHPEIEEDSARDGVSFADRLFDLGTDWNLLWTSMDWVMGWTISEPPDTSPPTTPEVNGPVRGKSGAEYQYTCISNDPELEEVYFYIDWGDENVSGWIGPFDSGEIVETPYSWQYKGEYVIRIRAKDVNGAESEWSDPLEIRISKAYESPIKTFFEKLFKRIECRYGIKILSEMHNS
jgi:hypothetical protein